MKTIDILKKEMENGIDKVLANKTKKFEAENIAPLMVKKYLNRISPIRR